MSGLLLPSRHYKGDAFLVSRDPRKPHAFRCTRFEAGEPVGHTEAPSEEYALKEARAHGADLARAVRVDASTVDAALSSFGL